MANPDTRRTIICNAEDILGSRLPTDLRDALIKDGAGAFATAEGYPFALVLSDDAKGPCIFEQKESGRLLDEIDAWDGALVGGELTKGAFLVAQDGYGNDYFLSPDAEGVARMLVFADHEIGHLNVIMPDIERPSLKPPRREPEIEDVPELENDALIFWDDEPAPEMEPSPAAKPPPVPDIEISSFRPAFAYALCAAGIATIVTMFVGAFLAYRWRDASTIAGRQYARLIRLFWYAMTGWAVAVCLFVIAVVLAKTGNGGTGVIFFKAAVILAFCTQLVFSVVCLFHSIRLSWGHMLRRPGA